MDLSGPDSSSVLSAQHHGASPGEQMPGRAGERQAPRERDGGAKIARRELHGFQGSGVPTQPNLFEMDGEPLPKVTQLGLVLIPGGKARLSKAQLAFNRLVARIEKLRRSIENEGERLKGFVEFYGAELYPLEKRIGDARKVIVRLLFPFLARGALGRSRSRPLLREMIQEELKEIIGITGELADPDLRDIFKEVEGKTVKEAEAEDFEVIREQWADMFASAGVDADLSKLRSDMSSAEVAAQLEEMKARWEAEEEARANAKAKAKPKSKQALTREARERAAEELRKRDVGGLYRQLAKLLHPDLEQDPALRVEKEAAMKELTTAYKNNDLHALLKLEVAWIAREQADASQLTDKKLAVYNAVLKEQVEELEEELTQVRLHPRFAPLMKFMDPFFGTLLFNGPKEKQRLTSALQIIEATTAALRGPDPKGKVLAMIDEFRQQKRAAPDWF